MSRITAIKRRVRPGAVVFRVFVDGQYSFSVSDLELSVSGMRVGQEVTTAELQTYREKADEAKAYALALRFLGVRLRSRHELLAYLERKGCERLEAEAALERLEALGLVDDARFAETWIADRQTVRPRSRLRLAQELAAKGVGREMVEAALARIEPEREMEALKMLIRRKQKLPAYEDRQKLVAYLQRQGYQWDSVKEALGQIDETSWQ